MKVELELSFDSVGDIVRAAGLAVVALAVFQELQKPPAMRTWRGEVAGVVPYDFRPPTLDRLVASYWNPSNPNLFMPTVFGVGWAVNIPSLLRNAGRLAGSAFAEAQERIAARS